MIPKKIHYIWLGGNEKNERMLHCIESWKKYLPDYEIIEWNESNLPMDMNAFFIESYRQGKWAFASDVARFWILYNYGGIYLDVDVEVYKPLDEFLDKEGFIGFEAYEYLSTGTIGAEAGNPIIKLIYDYYSLIEYKSFDTWQEYLNYHETSPCILSDIFGLLKYEINNTEQHLQHFSLYPDTYFHTQNEGYCYHSWNGSWN